jgi:arginine decarboxylase
MPHATPDPSTLPLEVLLASARVGDDGAVGRALDAIALALEALGVVVHDAATVQETCLALQTDPGLCVAVIDWSLAVGASGTVDPALVASVLARADDVPLMLLSDRGSLDGVPTAVLERCAGYVYPLDDTADWIAGRIRDAAARFRRAVLPDMFAALVAFAQTHEYSWHTPGHEGGAAFRKSAAGRAFFDFFGEQTFRSDLSISVGELGSLLDHSGPIGAAERRAARTFGADLTFFVTNGTSTSNRVVHQASVCAGDIMLLDRNAHKSMEQATTITHGVALYLLPTRNAYGIIGPVPPSELTAAAVAAKAAASPLVPDDARPVIATVTNSTYDGLLYHVPTVDAALGGHLDRVHYDEAWYGYARFNPLYHERHAMHRGDRPQGGPTTFATQSTHKLLAALSQASYLHVRNGARGALDEARLNEAFMMHASTSPLYAIIAADDVAAKMMEGRSGLALTRESIDEAVAFRRTLARIAAERAQAGGWSFAPWQPPHVAEADPEALASDPDLWALAPGDAWHGFGAALPAGYAMLDPIKVTVLTPGLAPDGSVADFGVPAPLVSAHLDQHASIVVEKTQDYSILFLFSIGVTNGKWGSLITALLACQRDVEANTPLRDALPATFAADPERYAGMGLADLAAEMHGAMRDAQQLRWLHDAFSALPEPVMPNADAYAHVVRGTVEQVRLKDLPGRTVAVGVVPYPPGIPLLMPGESAGAADGAVLGYLRALEAFDRRFPGFEHDLHGVDHVDGDYVIRCVAA